MKAIGIQIEGNEAILVVLIKDEHGIITQTNESVKLNLADHTDSVQVQQFRDQINCTFDSIKPAIVGIKARIAKAGGKLSPSPVSFKLEGIIQLYTKVSIDFVWSQTISAYKKKNDVFPPSKHKYQQDACDVAFYLLTK